MLSLRDNVRSQGAGFHSRAAKDVPPSISVPEGNYKVVAAYTWLAAAGKVVTVICPGPNGRMGHRIKACPSVDCERDDVVSGRDCDVLLAADRVTDRITSDGTTRLEPPKSFPGGGIEREECAFCRPKHQASRR